MARRGENIYKRKDGRWEGRILTKGIGYRYVYAKSYSELKQKLEFERRSTDTRQNTNKHTVDFFAEQWLISVKLRCRQSTYNKYKNICRIHIIPSIGNIRTECLQNDNISDLLDSIAELSPKTLYDILGVIKMILSYAGDCGCKSNVNMDALSVRVPRKEMRVLSVTEQLHLVQNLLEEPDLIKLGIYLALCTGIRIGELCALKRQNICFEDGYVHINSTMQRIQMDGDVQKTKVIITEPKSSSSIRDIPLTETLLKIVTKFYCDFPSNAFLLTGSAEKFIEPGVMRYHFQKRLRECGIESIHFHALRHTFATRCVESGMDIKTLSEILGHVNVKITLDRYVHSSMPLKRESLEKVSFFSMYSPSVS